ncbi:hypothetical protein MMC25_002113 [Agyrium rufum]|nr:hypothetical protein [Agyrium rufum]
MAANSSKQALGQLASARRAINVTKKYTLQSTGIWERIRRALAIDPDRSSGVPLNPQFRNPPPGANPPGTYDDPVTLPAGDIAENPYYRRDMRRSYPRLSVVNQADVVGLLTVGSKAAPQDGVLQIGDAGAKQLVQVKEQGQERGLAGLFEDAKGRAVMSNVLGAGGLPPLPSGQNRVVDSGAKSYQLGPEGEEGFPDG